VRNRKTLFGEGEMGGFWGDTSLRGGGGRATRKIMVEKCLGEDDRTARSGLKTVELGGGIDRGERKNQQKEGRRRVIAPPPL